MTKATQNSRQAQIEALKKDWAENPRWQGVRRPFTAEEVVALRGSVVPENTIAKRGAAKLWELVNGGAKKGYVNSLGALTGGQAVQQAKAGIEAIYLSGWQVAADANLAGTMYPDQSLYPANSVPAWWGGSITPSAAPIRSSGTRVKTRKMRVMSITSCRLWPMPKPDSVAC